MSGVGFKGEILQMSAVKLKMNEFLMNEQTKFEPTLDRCNGWVMKHGACRKVRSLAHGETNLEQRGRGKGWSGVRAAEGEQDTSEIS